MNDSNGKEYRYWTIEEVRPYIINYLKEKFSDSIIEREFSHVDIMVLGPNVPVEIQKATLQKNGNLAISQFEDMIRRQIEQNVSIFGQCWLFFDNKLLYHQCIYKYGLTLPIMHGGENIDI